MAKFNAVKAKAALKEFKLKLKEAERAHNAFCKTMPNDILEDYCSEFFDSNPVSEYAQQIEVALEVEDED
jgi:hypothetical protein